jgi:tetrahydromethanopterin S-methyltransferase subunit G
MTKQASFASSQSPLSVRVPKKFAGKKVVLVAAAEYARMNRRLAEIEDTLGKITRGEAAYRQGRTKIVRSLSELGR